MVGGTWGSSKGSRNAFAVAVRASRRSQLLSAAYGNAVDLLGSLAAIRRKVNNNRGAPDLLAAIHMDLLAAIINSRGAGNNSRGADLQAAIKNDRLAAIAVVDLHAAIIIDLLAAIVN